VAILSQVTALSPGSTLFPLMVKDMEDTRGDGIKGD
jgi:hypothetical protein